MASANEQTRLDAAKSLERMQEFEPESLPRETDLGKLNFREAVEPAKRLVDLYRRLAPAALEDFPEDKLQQIHNVANADYSILNQILTFDLEKQGNPQGARQNLTQQVTNTYPNTFQVLHPLIAYSLHRSADFQRLDREARATLQTVSDKSEELRKQLEGQLTEAQRIVAEVREVAAETGVSQQATYFKAEADYHNAEADTWRGRTVTLAWVLGIYGLASFTFAKMPFLRPEDNYQSIQLGVSKVLVFAVISFMLYLSARSYLSHKHNSIVNRHRQNALLTYRALADAASASDNREVILTHAAACIFGPQPTGYSQDGGDAARVSSVVEVFGKPMTGS